MTRSRLSLVVVGLVALMEGCDFHEPAPIPPPEPCRITLTVPADPSARLRVEMTLPSDAPEHLRLYAAAGAVGSYEPCNFTAFFHDVAAKDAGGASLAIVRPPDRSFQIAGHPRTITWEIDAAAGEREIPDLNSSTHRRPDYTLLSGYATFLVAEGLENRRHRLTLAIPATWNVESALECATEKNLRTLDAENALELLDEPIAMGLTFKSASNGTWVHVWSEGADDFVTTVSTLATASTDARRAVGALDPPRLEGPYHVYFELRIRAMGGYPLGWALEHGHSFQAVDEVGALDKPNRRLVYHLAHHMLHAWVPRTLYTDALRPLRQLRGEKTGAIWFAEGFPQYLAFVGMAKAGVAETPAVLEMLVRRFGNPYVLQAPETRRSMIERSLELSTGKHDEWFFGFSEGALLAMWLDEKLREQKPDGDGLAGAMRALAAKWPVYDAAWREGPGIPEDRFEAAFQDATGLDVADLFARHVRGREPLPVDEILGAAGIVRATKGFRVLPAADLTPEQARFRARAFR